MFTALDTLRTGKNQQILHQFINSSTFESAIAANGDARLFQARRLRHLDRAFDGSERDSDFWRTIPAD